MKKAINFATLILFLVSAQGQQEFVETGGTVENIRYVFEKISRSYVTAEPGYQLWECVATWDGRDNTQITAGCTPPRVKMLWVNAETLLEESSTGDNPKTGKILYWLTNLFGQLELVKPPLQNKRKKCIYLLEI